MSQYLLSTNPIRKVSGAKKAIVFDLDQTLVATQEDGCLLQKQQILTDPKFTSVRERLYDLTAEAADAKDTPWKFWGVLRPHFREFLEFAFSYFRVVGVWSAGTKEYVAELVKHIFPEGTRQPHIVFARDHVVASESSSVGKPLEKIYDHNEVFNRYMDERNTLIIDDNLSTSIYNPSNIVHIPKYDPPCNPYAMMADDIALLQLRQWLLKPEVRDAVDVRTLDKSKIFSEPLHVRSPGYNYI